MPPFVRTVDACGEEGILRGELVVAEEVEPLAAEGVRAGLGDGVDGAARGTPEFGGEVADADLEFLDRGLADRVGRTRTSAGFREERLVVIGAVDGVVVVQTGNAAIADQTEIAVVGNGRAEQDEVFPSAAVDREILDGRFADDVADVGSARVNERRFRRDGDRLGHAGRAHLDICGQCLANRHLEISKGRALKTAERRGDFVDARLQRRRAIPAAIVSHEFACGIRASVFYDYRDARQYGTGRVGHDSFDIAGRRGLCERDTRQREDRKNRRGQQTKHLVHRDSLERATHASDRERGQTTITGKRGKDSKTRANRVTQLPGTDRRGQGLRNGLVKSWSTRESPVCASKRASSSGGML